MKVTSFAPEGRVISNFALTHYQAAKEFSGKTEEIEAANSGHAFGNYWQEISIYCSASIIAAAAALEALINELYLTPGPLQEQILDFETFFWGSEIRERQYIFWSKTTSKRGLEKQPALKKYKKAASLLQRPSLSINDPEYFEAETLIGFRNYLIHFKPLWDENRRDGGLEDRLRGKFQTSPFPDQGAAFLEKHCMSSGCSKWAVQTVSDFVAYFEQKTGLDPNKLKTFC